MIRILGGEFKGRKLAVPPSDVRPTSNKVREAVFDILGARAGLDGARFLDWYAGSGAVGLEALSRGASFAEMVERDGRVLAVIRRNVETLGCSPRCRLTRGDAPMESHFDLVFVDPPYAKEPDPGIVVPFLVPGGYCLQETSHPEVAAPEGLESVKTYKYGGTYLHLYRRVSP